MKNLKKVLASLLAIATLSTCICAVPTSADVVFNDLEIIENADESNREEIILPEDFSIDDVFSVMDSDNKTMIINGEQFYLAYAEAQDRVHLFGFQHMFVSRGEFEPINTRETLVQDFIDNNVDTISFQFEDEDNLPWGCLFKLEDNEIIRVSNLYREPQGGSVDTDTIGDSESNTSNEIPLGDSPTGIRGDIDYDGDVDAVDLLLLKKYLLQMITW